MRYTKYSTTLEKQLLGDYSISDDIKRKLWNVMDEIDILISQNYINAKDGMDYIKNKVREYI